MIDIKELRRLAQAAIAKMNASDPEFASSTPPLAILELLDRLEAAEKDSAHHKALAESALRVAKGWEEKCNSLRAKIAEMEKQGPIGEIVAFGESLHEVSWIKGKLPLLGAKLYALPGAKGEEK